MKYVAAGSASPPALARLGVYVHMFLCSLTYELMQEDEWGDVAGQAQEFADYHEPVPRLDGQGHHEQLRQDERGEGNGDNMDELRLEEQQRAVHDDASCRVRRGINFRVRPAQHLSSVQSVLGLMKSG